MGVCVVVYVLYVCVAHTWVDARQYVQYVQLYASYFSSLAAWLSHIAANIVSKLVASAITKNADPRKDDEEDIQDSFILSRQDLTKVWFFLAREVLYNVLICA